LYDIQLFYCCASILFYNYSMNSIHDLVFQNVLKLKDESIYNEVISFWQDNNVLTEEIRLQRCKEVVFAIRNKTNDIIGLSTALKTFHNSLRSYVYLYRCFIAEKFRAPALDTILLVKTRDFLEEHSKSEKDNVIGMMVVVQTEFLKKWNKAIWPDSELMYVGNTKAGEPMRIYYFKGAKLEPSTEGASKTG